MTAGSFVERERLGSVQAVEDMGATVALLWRRCCEHDGIPVDSKMAVFSEKNPFVVFYNNAQRQYQEMSASCAVHGYTGLSLKNREVYKRTRKKKA